jgi:hypothetical protein
VSGDAEIIRRAAIQFMQELTDQNWPSDGAWNALRAACGLAPLPAIRRGGDINALHLIAPQHSTDFKP